MTLANWGVYLNRTTKILRDGTANILRMSGADPIDRSPKTLFTLNSQEEIYQFSTGCDGDIGGLSTASLTLDETHKDPDGKPAAKFSGEMRLGVKPELQGKLRAGYAGFRSRRRPTLFSEIMEDLTFHRYLALRLRLAGHPRTRNSYYVNLQTDTPIRSDLWQHRLYFKRDDGGWEDVYIPLHNFVLTNSGDLVDRQIRMSRSKVCTIGVSLLGGNSGIEGPYELGISSIKAINEEDMPEFLEKNKKGQQ
ncbi:hypothetical protein PLICRDRAFT_697617 [Plicaturopsis crispa FD-325 SS-3]|nr:hypothetical protein PLICRDRAFT_697617 [Plicaturopsis crispa FD-325 SS-3]